MKEIALYIISTIIAGIIIILIDKIKGGKIMDLDDEELEATRRAKGLLKENTYIRVLNELVNTYMKEGSIIITPLQGAKYIQAIQTLLEENSMLHKVNKIADSVTLKDIENALKDCEKEFHNNYIEKQIIINEYNKILNHYNDGDEISFNDSIRIELLNKILKEEK